MGAKNNFLATDCQQNNSPSLSPPLWSFSREERAGTQPRSWLWECTRVGISSARGWPGGRARQACPFQEAYGQLCEDSTILVLRSPLSSLCRKESRESVLKDRFEADPVIRVGLTLVASGNILNDIPLTPADVCRLNCRTPVARSKAWLIKKSRLCFIPIYLPEQSKSLPWEGAVWAASGLAHQGPAPSLWRHQGCFRSSCLTFAEHRLLNFPDCPDCDAACLLLLSVQNFICMKLMLF